MIKVQITPEFLEWFTGEFPFVTNEPLTAAKDIVTQLFVTGCIPDNDAPALAAELARLKAQVEAMRAALKMARLLLEGVGYEGGSTHEAVCAALGGE